MEDSLNYMNSVSEASSVLNQLGALQQQASMQFEEKKQALGQEIEIPSELTLTAVGSVLGKKAIGLISEKLSSTVSDVASKAGISEETVSKALSGDIQGAIEQGTQEVSQTASNLLSQATEAVSSAVSGATSAAEGAVGAATSAAGEAAGMAAGVGGEATGLASGLGAEATSVLSSFSGPTASLFSSIAGSTGSIEGSVSGITSSLSGNLSELASGIVGRVSSLATNLPSISAPSVDIEGPASMYARGLEDVQSQFSFNSVPAPAGAEIELQDVTTFPSATAGEAGAEAGAAAEATAADVASTAAAASEATAAAAADAAAGIATAGAEAAGAIAGAAGEAAGIAASSVLGPIGLLV